MRVLLQVVESTLLRMELLTQVHLHYQVQCKAMQEPISKPSQERHYNRGIRRQHMAMAMVSKAAINSIITTMEMMGIQLELKHHRP